MNKVYIVADIKEIADDIVKVSNKLYDSEAKIISEIVQYQIEVIGTPKQLLEIGMYIGMNTYTNVSFSKDIKLYTIGEQLVNKIGKDNK